MFTEKDACNLLAEKLLIGRINVPDTQCGQTVEISLNRADMELACANWDMENDRITICVHQSKAGKWCAKIDTWKPSPGYRKPNLEHATGPEDLGWGPYVATKSST